MNHHRAICTLICWSAILLHPISWKVTSFALLSPISVETLQQQPFRRQPSHDWFQLHGTSDNNNDDDTSNQQSSSRQTASSTVDSQQSRSKNNKVKVDNTSTSVLFSSQIGDGPVGNKKKKKNKYAQFSKADKIEKDPFDTLVEESQQKLQTLKEELSPSLQQRRQQQAENLPAPPTEALTKLEFPNNKDIDPYDPTTFGYIEIGTIQGPHGVHGWTKVQGMTDFPERLTCAGTLLHIKAPKKRAPRKIVLASGKFLGNDQFLIQLQGVFDREAAKTLRGATLYYAKQHDSVELQDDEVIVSDLVGLKVFRLLPKEEKEEEDVDDDDDDIPTEAQELVGTVMGVVLAEEMCAIPGLLHDQMEVALLREGQVPQPGQPQDLVLIPMVPEIVPRIDLDQKRILIDPPPGLLDLTFVREEKVRIKGLLAPATKDRYF